MSVVAYRLLLLGPPALVRGADSRVLPFERRTQLLALLGLAGRWVGRREAAAMLWPAAAAPAAAANLRKTLFRLAALPWGGCVRDEGGALRLDGETDLAAFEAALRDGRVAEALALWQGDPLAGFDDDANEPWTERLRHERERLRAAWRGAALERLEAELSPPVAVDLSARLLEADPWDETALRLHLGWLQRSGQAARAAQVHARFVERVRADLGVAPSAALAALAPDRTATRPPAPQPAAAPVRMASVAAGALDPGFIGRAAELRQVASRLESDDGRLVTLLGPGGIGKTRLARRAAQELAAGFADGALVVALEDLDDASALADRLARAAGLDAAGEGGPQERLLQHLAGRRLLLVLDNFEHLMAAAPLLPRILERCPGVKILVSSRMRLALPGEQLLVVDGLPCPDAQDIADIEAFDAVRLFVRAARRVHPDFSPSAEAAAIVEICARVGGWPLALELAAAWTRVLSCADIAAELRRGAELLQQAGAAAPGRHASIEAVLEPSWRLLGDAERRALTRLSLFRGGFTADAARAVAGAAPPVLAALADRSLLARDGARMRLHALVQQYAAERLGEDDDARRATQGHARHYLGLMARLAAPARDGAREALRELETEFDNCRAAWQRAAVGGEGDLLARAAGTLCDFCDYRGRVAEGLALVEEALASPRLASGTGARALLDAASAHLLYRLDRYDAARVAASRALALAAALGDDEAQLQALNTLGSCALHQGRLDEAAAHFHAHLKRAPAASDPHRAARTMMNLAMVEQAAGRLEPALAHYGEALVLLQRFGDASAEVRCLHNLALLHLSRRELDAAGSRLQAALTLCDRHGFIAVRAIVQGALVDHARLVGDFDAAQRHAEAALQAARALGQRGLMCGLTLDFVHLALHRGDAEAARRSLGDAAAQALDLGRPSMRLSVLSWFAELLVATGERVAARRVLELLAQDPAASPPQRADYAARGASLARQPGAATGGQAGAALAVDELLPRIAAEAGIGHLGLIVELRS